MALLIAMLLCITLLLIQQFFLPRFQAEQAANNYLYSVKANDHIQSWTFTNRIIMEWDGGGGPIAGGQQAYFAGEVIYDDGHRGAVTVILDDGWMDVLSAGWMLDKADFGTNPDPTPTPYNPVGG